MDFIVTDSGVISAVIDGQVYNVDKTNINYENCKKALVDNDPKKFEHYANVAKSVVAFSHGKVEIRDGIVYHGNKEVHNSCTRRLLQLMSEGFPFKHMLLFLENVKKNPSNRAVEELYTFLEHRNLPITENGTFLAYKRVRENWTDFHSGTVDYHLGNDVEIPRNEVDDNFNNGCSRGLHVGALSYVETFGSDGHIIICEVHPQDVVSVPSECSFTKLRCCKLKVVSEFTGELTKALYRGDGQESQARHEEWDADYGYDCGDCDDDDCDDDYDDEEDDTYNDHWGISGSAY